MTWHPRLGNLRVLLLLFAFAVCCCCCKSERPDDELSEPSDDGVSKVDRVMTRFAKGIFNRKSRHDISVGSGWIMTTELGVQFRRPFLQYQAKELIEMGSSARLDLVNWLEHEQMEIRYIALYSLEQITGEDIGIPSFASLEQIKEAGWRQKLRDKFAQDRPTEQRIVMRHMGGTKFGVVVLNASDRSILVGAMNSALGFDQFLFRVRRTPGGVASIERNEMWFTDDDTRIPLVIPKGSYHEFAIDFADGTWKFDEGTWKSWEAIMVVYQSEACDLAEERSKKRVFAGNLKSKWIEILSADDR